MQVELLVGDPAKAERLLGWKPTTLFEDLVKEMVEEDVKLVEKGDLRS